MKIYNRQRGSGKTTRMLYASEFNNVPILCANNIDRALLNERANESGIKIPTPITVGELKTNKSINIDKILIDEFDYVMSELFERQFDIKIVGATMTVDME